LDFARNGFTYRFGSQIEKVQTGWNEPLTYTTIQDRSRLSLTGGRKGIDERERGRTRERERKRGERREWRERGRQREDWGEKERDLSLMEREAQRERERERERDTRKKQRIEGEWRVHGE
jgi:hypothetical protein